MNQKKNNFAIYVYLYDSIWCITIAKENHPFPIHGADKLLIKIRFVHHYNSILTIQEFYHINPQGYLPFQFPCIKT